MARLLGLLKHRAFVSFLGVVALGLLVWFIGPLIAIAGYTPLDSVWSRALGIAVLLGAWGTVVGWRSLAATLRNRRMVEEIAEAGAEPSAELDTLRRRMEEALAVLKKARLGGKGQGRRYLYQLPWYILIGAPGSGKTTALVNSGLHFPLAERFGPKAIRGVGGTRNCDWWFTDEAVLLDTAGRYTTQDSHQAADHGEWTGFLALLKRYRPRRPINGALVAVSIGDLLTQSEAERTAHARAIRQRIQELQEQLGLRVPVYVLLTKADLLAGFVEFFDDLDREGRIQVWGTTFPVDDPPSESGTVARFPSEFDTLKGRLDARLIDRLHQERDPQRRASIYRFPRQFTAIKEAVDSFLKEVFWPSPYEDRPLLRGVYLTSGTQEGTPIDRLMGTMASQFGLDRGEQVAFSGTGRSYFITRLFRDVIFKEAGLAGTNLRFERRLAWLRRGAYAGTLALVALVLGGWTVSYLHNRAYVTETLEEAQAARDQLEGVSRNETDLLAVVPALNRLRHLPGGYTDQDQEGPWLMGLGLSQEDKLGPVAKRAYLRALEQAFLPRLLFRLEKQLKENWNNTEFLYEGLKVYLMLGNAEHFEPESIRAWMALDWEQNLPRSVSSEQRQQLRGHLEALLAQGPTEPPVPPDKGLIRQARAKLKEAPPAEWIYARLKRTSEFDTLSPFRVNEAAGPQATRVFTRASGKPLSEGVKGLYTYRGYRTFLAKSEEVVDRLIKESWVLGEARGITKAPEERQRLAEQVKRRYLKDYRQRWEALLEDIEVAPLIDLDQAVEIVNVLASSDSPMRQLLEAVARETNLQRQPREQIAEQSQQEGKVAKERLAEIVGGAGASPQSEKKDPVTQHFSPLRRQVQAGGNESPPIQSNLALLDKLYVHLDGIASAADRGRSAYEALRDRNGNVVGRVERQAQRSPPPIRRWLRSVAQGSSNLISGGAHRYLNAMWSSKVRAYYKQALAGRYPLDPDSPRRVTLEDFGRFFGPGGVVEQFFEQYLQPFVDTSTSRGRWRAKGQNELSLSDTTLHELQRAAMIREAFFTGGSQEPKARFELVPVVMDAAAHQFTLNLHGQTVSYSHGPVRPTLLKWPGPGDPRQVRITWYPPTADGRSAITKNGPWAWFRLLDEARLEPTGNPASLRVTFGPPEREATFELRASSTQHPFQLEALERFRCPEQL